MPRLTIKVGAGRSRVVRHLELPGSMLPEDIAQACELAARDLEELSLGGVAETTYVPDEEAANG